MSEETLHVLLVEDDEVDREAARRAFEEFGLLSRLHVAEDGEDALEQLRSKLGSPELPAPLLILLDLKMPRMGGLEFLRELRADPDLQGLPVVVTTVSAMKRDVRDAYDLGVEGYLIKPVGYRKFVASLVSE